MPNISEFYGIKIYIYWKDIRQHNIPHFHAVYSGKNAAFDLKGNIIAGKMPLRAKKMIKLWAVENYDQLVYAWECALSLKAVPKIKGLK